MLKTLLLCALAVLLACSSSRAAEDGPPGGMAASPAPKPQAEPCDRAPMGMRLGNFDPDVVKCQAALMAEQLGEEAALKAGARAAAILANKDKTAAEGALAQREKAWRDYFAAYIGAAPTSEPKSAAPAIEPHVGQ